MDAITGEIRGLEDARKLVRNISARLANPRPAMEAIGNSLITSIQRNFEDEGRPTKWTQLKSPYRELKRKLGARSDKILHFSGALMDSINPEVSSDGRRLVIGTNLIYAAAHQSGYTYKAMTVVPKRAKALRFFGEKGEVIFRKKVNIPPRTLPARPFIVIQDEDIEEIKHILGNFLTK